jgi:hypothetical protein
LFYRVWRSRAGAGQNIWCLVRARYIVLHAENYNRNRSDVLAHGSVAKLNFR